jgi:hypothetical protein
LIIDLTPLIFLVDVVNIIIFQQLWDSVLDYCMISFHCGLHFDTSFLLGLSWKKFHITMTDLQAIFDSLETTEAVISEEGESNMAEGTLIGF